MFSFVKNINGKNFPVIVEKPCAAATYEIGDALRADSSTGYVTKCSGTYVPEFICAQRVTSAATAGDSLAVNPVVDGQIWETVFSADGSALKAGAKVTISSTANSVTATTTNGVAELLEDGGASGASVLVKF